MIQFIKTRDVKDPVRNVAENAGIDFYIPEANDEFIADLAKKNISGSFLDDKLYSKTDKNVEGRIRYSYFDYDTNEIFIAPHCSVIIPTGIRSKFPNNLALIANNKSGIATKKQLIFGASVIDASYEGEWHIHLINTSNEYQSIKCGTKAIQFIPHIISTDEIEIVNKTPEEFYKYSTSSRGEGWQGSTGIN